MDSNSILRKMRQHTPSVLGNEEYAKYAVLLPLVEIDNEIHILFEIRSHQLRRQPGEICFPGGKMDQQDQTEQDTAIRETMEELCISETEITDVFPFDYLVSPFGMMIYTHVGTIKNLHQIKPNTAEVAEIFTVPLSFFMDTKPKIHHVDFEPNPEENFPHDLVPGGENYNWRTSRVDEHFYIYDDKVIWGLTARIITEFVEFLKR